MPDSNSPHEEKLSARKPPRLGLLYALAAFAFIMAFASAYQAWQHFVDPFPNWFTTAPRWYDRALEGLLSATIAAATLAYIRRRVRRGAGSALPRPWHLRHEVRLVLYVFAGIQILNLPLAFHRTFAALGDPATPAFARGFIDLFPFAEAVLHPIIGVVAIVYDRRRAAREEREANNQCLRCGYDLRASPDRCPECGWTWLG